jgi:hypothetical protein
MSEVGVGEFEAAQAIELVSGTWEPDEVQVDGQGNRVFP